MNARQARRARAFALIHRDNIRWALSTPGARYTHAVTTPHGLTRTRWWISPEPAPVSTGELMVDDS